MFMSSGGCEERILHALCNKVEIVFCSNLEAPVEAECHMAPRRTRVFPCILGGLIVDRDLDVRLGGSRS